VSHELRKLGLSKTAEFEIILISVFCCSMVAAVGLVESSAVNIVAAMLISPLMVKIDKSHKLK